MPSNFLDTKPDYENLPDVTQLKVDASTAYGQVLAGIKDPPEHSVIITFRPEDADRILTRHNDKNRPFKLYGIRDYIKDMEEGRWSLTGDTIKFGMSGRLLDGQNRLSACFTSGKPFASHVVFGINEDFFKRIDVGRPRSASDILAIAGYKNTINLASAVRNALIFDGLGEEKQRRHFRPERLLEALEGDYADILDFLGHGVAIYQTLRYPTGEATALLRKMHHISPEHADAFYKAWRFGYTEGRATVVRRMMEYLQALKSRVRGGLPGRTRQIVVITAWNMFRQNKKGSLAAFDRALESGHGLPPFDGDTKE